MGWFCRCCSPPAICEFCNGGEDPEEITIVISGVTDIYGWCSNCPNVNGTYVLPRNSLCWWRKVVTANGTLTGSGSMTCQDSSIIFDAFIYGVTGSTAYLGVRITFFDNSTSCSTEYRFDYVMAESPTDCCSNLTPAVTMSFTRSRPTVVGCFPMCDFTTGSVTAECTA